jgi:hypothetical protein
MMSTRKFAGNPMATQQNFAAPYSVRMKKVIDKVSPSGMKTYRATQHIVSSPMAVTTLYRTGEHSYGYLNP